MANDVNQQDPKGIAMSKKLNNEEIETMVEQTIELAETAVHNQGKVLKNLHILYKNIPGTSEKKRKKSLKKLFDKESFSSYIYKLIDTVVLEIKLKLPAGTLCEYHARLLYELKYFELMKSVYLKAVELADGKPLLAKNIKKAIEEVTTTVKPSEITKEKPKQTARKSTSQRATTTDEDYYAEDDEYADDEDDYYAEDDEYEEDDYYADDEYEEDDYDDAEDVYKNIKDKLNYKSRKIILVKMLKDSDFWSVVRILINSSMSEDNVNKMVELIDPKKEYRDLLSKLEKVN